MSSNEKNEYLGTEKIGKLMIKFSVPCVLSLLVSALYNIVDQIFIGRGIGYLGNGATNVVYPITVIALAISLMIGDGCAAFLSICEGRKDTEKAHATVGNAVVINITAGILLTILFAVFKAPILRAFGGTENNLPYASEYFDYLLIGIPFFIFGGSINSVIRADGSPRYSMLCMLVGCLINVILDPIAIFVLNLGMKGAALATILGQIVSASLGFAYLFRMKVGKLSAKSFKPQLSIIKRFLPLGISSFLTQISMVVIMGVMNNVLVKYGALSRFGADIPLTVVGVCMKVFGIVISISVGIAVGAQPIVGYNYGAGNFERVKEVYRKVTLTELILGLLALAVFELFPQQIINIFGSGDALYNEFAVLTFRIFLMTIPLGTVQRGSSIFLQALGKPGMSMGLSMTREFVLSIPLILLLPKLGGVVGVLYSAPIADLGSIIMVVILMIITFKQLNKQARGEHGTV